MGTQEESEERSPAHFFGRSFQHAVGLLDTYTQCGAGFAELKAAYASSGRAHESEQRTLREVWAAAAAAIGRMAAQVADTGMLQELAAHDVAGMAQAAPGSSCNETAFMEAAVEAVREGLFGQTVRQLDTLFTEMALLRQRQGSLPAAASLRAERGTSRAGPE